MEDTWELVVVSEEKTQDELDIKISPKDGVEVNSKGTGTSRLINAVADVISPVSKFLGLLGDQFEYLRLYQAQTFNETMKKVERRATEKNLEVTPVPLKIGVQWAEAASLEDIENPDNLSDIWAELLVSEVEFSNPNFLIYVDILKKLNKSHILYLRSLLGKSYPYAVGNPAITFGQNLIEYMLSEPFNDETDDPSKAISKIPDLAVKKQIIEINQLPGVEMLTVSTITNDPLLGDAFGFEWIREQDTECEADKPDLIFNSLAALELVTRKSAIISVFNRRLEINYIASILTPLGWHFLRACNSEE